jgi:acetaldehyde dehydrogenase
MGAMVGIDPSSDGLARAQRLGVATTHEGIEGLQKLDVWPEIGVVFDATSAGAHKAHMRSCVADGGQGDVDLTPAAIGRYVIPGQWRRSSRCAQRQHGDLRRAGDDPDGRGGRVGRQGALCRDRRVDLVALRWPRHARQYRRVHPHDRAGIEVGGAKKGKAIIILNPAEPPMIMRDTVFTPVRRRRRGDDPPSIEDMVPKVQRLCARLPPQAEGAVRALRFQQPGEDPRLGRVRGDQDQRLPRSGRRGRIICPLMPAISTS